MNHGKWCCFRLWRAASKNSHAVNICHFSLLLISFIPHKPTSLCTTCIHSKDAATARLSIHCKIQKTSWPVWAKKKYLQDQPWAWYHYSFLPLRQQTRRQGDMVIRLPTRNESDRINASTKYRTFRWIATAVFLLCSMLLIVDKSIIFNSIYRSR